MDAIKNVTGSSSGGYVEATANVLKHFVRDASVSRLRSASLNKFGMELREAPIVDDFVYGHWMSFILMSGKDVQVTFKSHFMSKDTRVLVAAALRKDIGAITHHMVMDFMREYCNLAAGEIKAQLQQNQVGIGLSLPLITRGFDEVVFSDRVDKKQIIDAWQVAWKGGHLVCSSVIEVLDWNALTNIRVIEKQSNDDGDVELL